MLGTAPVRGVLEYFPIKDEHRDHYYYAANRGPFALRKMLHKANEDTEYSYLGEPSLAMKLRQYGVAAMLTLYGILLMVLFILYASIDEEDEDAPPGAIATFQAVTSFTSAQIGLAVSLTSAGALQLGGGTSVYKDVYVEEEVCAKTTNMEAVFDSSYFMTYVNGFNESTTLSVLESDNARDLQLSYSKKYDKALADIVALDSASGLIVGITQDSSAEEDDAVIVAMKANNDDKTISIGEELKYGGIYSMNPQIVRLSPSSFAVTFLQNVTTDENKWEYMAFTAYGIVENDLSVTLSTPVIFAPDSDFKLQSVVVGVTEDSYLLVMNPSQEESVEGFDIGPLQARVATVNGEGGVELGAVNTFPYNLAAFNMAAANVDGNTVLVVYSDPANNFGITATSLKSGGDGVVSVASTLALSSGQALSEVNVSLVMDLDIGVYGDDHFVVAYSDISNGGKLTSVIGQISDSAELTRVSPDFLVNDGNKDTDAIYQWHAIAIMAGSSNFDAQIALTTSLQDLSCDLNNSTLSVSVMDVLPSPVGVLVGKSRRRGNADVADVQMSGWVGGYHSVSLSPGKTYYTNTFGELIDSNAYWGNEDKGAYAHDESSKTLATGFVGVAMTESKMLLKV